MVLRGHEEAVFFADFGPRDRMLVSASHDGNVRCWDLKEEERAAGRSDADEAAEEEACLLEEARRLEELAAKERAGKEAEEARRLRAEEVARQRAEKEEARRREEERLQRLREEDARAAQETAEKAAWEAAERVRQAQEGEEMKLGKANQELSMYPGEPWYMCHGMYPGEPV